LEIVFDTTLSDVLSSASHEYYDLYENTTRKSKRPTISEAFAKHLAEHLAEHLS
jgi:hypothetical protein